MVGYTCKYTPIELLTALGAQCLLLNGEEGDVQFAEGETHAALCSHAKALLQACTRREIRELVLVNCCDSIRRVYDVLKAGKGIEFLFFLDLPHSNSPAAIARLAEELTRLAKEYTAYQGAAFDYCRFTRSFQNKPLFPDGPYLAVLGGRVADGLLEQIRAHAAFPVADLTCGGNRRVSPPGEEVEFERLMLWYAEELLRQIPCMRMTDIAKRRLLHGHSGMQGVLYHTVKFCDYYSMEYESIKKETALPLLKIESDFTPQAAGQLSTRMEAFMEQVSPGKAKSHAAQGERLYAGIDSGSTTTNVVIIDQDGNLRASAIVRTGPRARAGMEKAMEEIKTAFGISRENLSAMVATGYGRNNITIADAVKTEITCHARGAHFLYPAARSIIDIGGQDSKVICLNETGGVKSFVMNDKCAAGTGRFLEMMARTLELDLYDMGKKGRTWNEDLTVSSMCTVFAESEVISLIAENKADDDIIHGLNKAVASKTASLAHRAGATAPYMMTGGVARNRGVVEALEEKLNERLYIAENPDLCGALGAALFAREL